ncbi:hypothetical protein ACOZ4B_18650 [Haloferax prahovense]
MSSEDESAAQLSEKAEGRYGGSDEHPKGERCARRRAVSRT